MTYDISYMGAKHTALLISPAKERLPSLKPLVCLGRLITPGRYNPFRNVFRIALAQVPANV